VRAKVLGRIVAAVLMLSGGGPAMADKMIKNDRGGDVAKYLREIDRLRSSGERVWVYGTCGSSCTLHLALGHQTCTAKHAKWLFHGPSAHDGKTPLDPWVFEFTTRTMAKSYPEPLAKWFMSTGRNRIGAKFYAKSGSEILRYGVRECAASWPR
jgi:hypothetical protein